MAVTFNDRNFQESDRVGKILSSPLRRKSQMSCDIRDSNASGSWTIRLTFIFAPIVYSPNILFIPCSPAFLSLYWQIMPFGYIRHASAHGGVSTSGLSDVQILVPWNNHFCKIVLPVSGFFLVILYYFDCVGPMLPRHILILDGPTMYMLQL